MQDKGLDALLGMVRNLDGERRQIFRRCREPNYGGDRPSRVPARIHAALPALRGERRGSVGEQPWIEARPLRFLSQDLRQADRHAARPATQEGVLPASTSAVRPAPRCRKRRRVPRNKRRHELSVASSVPVCRGDDVRAASWKPGVERRTGRIIKDRGGATRAAMLRRHMAWSPGTFDRFRSVAIKYLPLGSSSCFQRSVEGRRAYGVDNDRCQRLTSLQPVS